MFASPLMTDIHDIFGDKIKLIFSTRLPKNTSISFAKVLKNTDKQTLEDFWMGALGLPYEEKYDSLYQELFDQRKNFCLAELIAASYAAVIKCNIYHFTHLLDIYKLLLGSFCTKMCYLHTYV